MVPTARRIATALGLSAAAFALAGCSIPGLGQVAGGTPTVNPPTTAPTAAPTTAGSTPDATPTPSRTRPSTTTRPSTRPTTPASAPSTPADPDEVVNGYLPKASVEIKVQQLIKERTGQSSYVQCPGNLDARTGATMTCHVKSVGGKNAGDRPVDLKVTDIQGKRVQFSIQVRG